MRYSSTVVALALAVASVAHAQFPERAVTLVVPLPQGDIAHTTARLVAGKLTEYWGRAVFADAKPGNAGAEAAGEVAKATKVPLPESTRARPASLRMPSLAPSTICRASPRDSSCAAKGLSRQASRIAILAFTPAESRRRRISLSDSDWFGMLADPCGRTSVGRM